MRIDNPQIFPALWIQAKDTDKSAGIRHVLNSSLVLG